MRFYIATVSDSGVRFLLGMHEAGGYEFTNLFAFAWPFNTLARAEKRVALINVQYPQLKLQIVNKIEAKNLTKLEPNH